MEIQSIRGTHDILPGSVETWQKIEAAARELFFRYGYSEIRTPIFEETELFVRSIGSETDIVRKEMYTLEGGGKSLTLRPEGTAPVVRAFIEHGLHATGLPCRLFYIGPMFRRERPQKGRYRQFHQIGAEVLGSQSPAVEAEIIDLLTQLLENLSINQYQTKINSVGCPACRPAYVSRLQEALRGHLDSLCTDCRRRTESNPLRVLDCKVAACQPVIAKLPRIADQLCADCRDHFQQFRSFLDLLDLEYETDPRLVRGLDYYVRTTFEIVSPKLGPTQNALAGGGRYDGLSELLGGPSAQGFGFALGLERLVLLLSGRSELQAPFAPAPPRLFLAWIDLPGLEDGLRLASELRREGLSVFLDFEGRSLKAQLRLANRMKVPFVCVIGEEERVSGIYPLKRMADGEEIRLGRAGIGRYIQGEDLDIQSRSN